MGGTGVVDRFLTVFSRYIDSGFGLLSGEVAFIATTLIVIDVTLAALFWSWGEQDDIIARLVKKTLFVGIFAYIIGNWSALADIVFRSFAGLGLKASGSGLGAADLLRPGRVAQVGIDAARPLLDSMAELLGYVSFFENFLQIAILLLAWAIVILAFFILAIQLFVTLIEFKLSTLAGFVLIPFGLFGKTAFMAERVLGTVISSGIKVLVLAVIIGIGSTLFAEFTTAIPGEPTIEDALAIVLASLTLLGLGIFGPGIANGIVAGARLAGGAVASATSSVAHGTSRAAGGATMAYATGAAGRSGGAAVAGGMAAIGRAAGGVALSPLRQVADSAKADFREGARSAIGHMGGRIIPASGAAPQSSEPDSGPPAWAKSMKQRQTLGASASLAAHTVRSGDGHGAGASVDTREKE